MTEKKTAIDFPIGRIGDWDMNSKPIHVKHDSGELDAVYRHKLLGGLYYKRTVINRAFVYDLVDGSVGIDYPDAVVRRISKDWYDDVHYDEPTDESIEEIVLEVLATDITECDKTVFGCSWPFCVNMNHCDDDYRGERMLLGRYVNELIDSRLLIL